MKFDPLTTCILFVAFLIFPILGILLLGYLVLVVAIHLIKH